MCRQVFVRPEWRNFMFEIDKQKFGVFVAMLRKEKGLTQKELAKGGQHSGYGVIGSYGGFIWHHGNGAFNVPAYGAGWHYGYGPGGKCGENGYFLF